MISPIYPRTLDDQWSRIQPGKSYTHAENEVREVHVVGKYEFLNGFIGNTLKPGTWFSGGDSRFGIPASYAIRTVTLTKEEGYDGSNEGTFTKHIGILHLSLVWCASETSPFETTVDVDLREVSKSLITHPDIQSDGIALKQIRLWNETPEARRISYVEGNPTFWYYDPESETPDTPIKVSNTNAVKYLLALSGGIESYNVYLPVVQRVTRYIKLPGDSGSTISLQYDDDLGHFVDSSSVPECPSGYTKGLWFKNVDRYSRAADGVWTRMEEWTFTNDKTHEWIYKELDD